MSAPDRKKRLRVPPLAAVAIVLGAVVMVPRVAASGDDGASSAAPVFAHTAVSLHPSCLPEHRNASAVLRGTPLSVSPLPGSRVAPPRSQVSLVGAPASQITNVSATGSNSGAHSGRIVAYSQGDGASFVPDHPFRYGEKVYVRGKVGPAGHKKAFAYHFTVAVEDPIHVPRLPANPRNPRHTWRFRSEPGVQPPVITITRRSARSAPGDLFAAEYSAGEEGGPVIFDDSGRIVWFKPMRGGISATNLQVQTWEGKKVLTWWQGIDMPTGFGRGEEIIDNSAYQQLAVVHAGNGLWADLHDFHIEPRNIGLITAYNPVRCDLTSVGGPRYGAVTEATYQEIDLKTGLIRRQWDALDHIGYAASYSSPRNAVAQHPFDYFHLNSIDILASGRVLISARNTSALYELDHWTGRILSAIGGRWSSYRLGPGARTAYQHDAELQRPGVITVFDNGANPRVHSQSRALVLGVNKSARKVEVLHALTHTPALSAGSQGNIQRLPDGNLFVGWGGAPWFTEYAPGGAEVFDGRMTNMAQSYRVYRFPWSATPAFAPSIALQPSGSRTKVFASWNGATTVKQWRVLAGSSPGSLKTLTTRPSRSFETVIYANSSAPYFAVAAVGEGGKVLRTSAAVKR